MSNKLERRYGLPTAICMVIGIVIGSGVFFKAEKILSETDRTNLMEGLYIKVEENGVVVERMKYVRYSFLQTVEESDSHWLDRPIIPNKITATIEDLLEE